MKNRQKPYNPKTLTLSRDVNGYTKIALDGFDLGPVTSFDISADANGDTFVCDPAEGLKDYEGPIVKLKVEVDCLIDAIG